MEQRILKHNEHYLGEIGTRDNLAAVIFEQCVVPSLGKKKEVESCQGRCVLFYPQRAFHPILSLK